MTNRRRMPRLRVGDIVEVLSAKDILATLDERGEFEELQFMPEMLRYCGKRMVVHKSAHKLCEIVTTEGGLRWMNNAVHLKDARCSGEAHGGCQTACSIYWKEAWLRRVAPGPEGSVEPETASTDVDTSALSRAARRANDAEGNEFYSCQGTEILRAAPDRIRTWHLGQYIADVRSGNVGVLALLRTLFFQLFNAYQARSRRYLPRWLRIKDGLAWGFVSGCLNGPTPAAKLDLQAGEVVRIKSRKDILQTLNSQRLNRGMGFEEEMARSCGTVTRVTRRIERCVDEKTGKLVTMKTPCVILDGVTCRGVYHGNCPKEYIPFWREVWLERVETRPDPGATNQTG